MTATIQITLPEIVAKTLGTSGELPRPVLEALVAHAYRAGQLSHAEVAEVLGFDRWETDEFLKKEEAYRPINSAQLDEELEAVRKVAKI